MYPNMAYGLRGYMNRSGNIIELPEETMKISYPKNTSGIALFFFFLLFNFFLMPSPSGGSLETGARIGANAFQPGTMILLGSALIGLAGWGRKKFRK